MFGFGIDLRLLLAHPKNLRRGEAGKGRIGHQFDQRGSASRFFLDLPALFGRALVVPQQRGPKGHGGVAKEDAAVHLSRQADGGNVGPLEPGLFQNRLGGGNGCLPPIFGILLRPAGLGR